MTPDHEDAKAWAEHDAAKGYDPFFQKGRVNLAACYLDALARLAKATELLRELVDGLVPCNEPAEPGSVVARVCAFLERKTDDKQS